MVESVGPSRRPCLLATATRIPSSRVTSRNCSGSTSTLNAAYCRANIGFKPSLSGGASMDTLTPSSVMKS
ncbi:hypothetical protein D3C78_1775840 [compost metagenome]